VKIEVDQLRCASTGMCAMLAPAVFELDASSTLVVLQPDVPAEEAAAVLDAIECCPTEAISAND